MKLGNAFSDSIHASSSRIRHSGSDDTNYWWLGAGRVIIFALLFFLAFFILLVRLFDLTVIRGHQYRVMSDGNRIRELTRHAPRGKILDRSGQIIADNIAQYRLVRPCEQTEKTTESGACVTYITKAKGEEMQQKGLTPGTFLEADYQRRYLDGESVAHIVGYTGEITDQELHQNYYQLRQYKPGDHVGRTGAEAVYEEQLRGRDGRELVEVDSSGRIIRILGRDPEIPGTDITLSIDSFISKTVRTAFPHNEKGAIVVSNPQTGEILAMYSSPSYDPNIFSQEMKLDEYQKLVKNPDIPLFNRAISGVYPPGSTFKIVTSLSGLEEKVITKNTIVEDTGILKVGQFSFANWFFTQYGKTEGPVNIVKALQRSNDIFFYQVGKQIGIDKIAKWAHLVGIGKPLGIELGGEAGGLMPDPEWKKSHFTTPSDLDARNNLWYDGDTYHVAIGQGYLLTTPLQVNTWTNLIANSGKICKPTILKNVKLNKSCQDLKISSDTISTITQGMKLACETGGTAWPLFDYKIGVVKTDDGNLIMDTPAATSSSQLVSYTKIPLACKTGTAEYGDPQNHTHAWFTVFAPLKITDSSEVVDSGNTKTISDNPEISITVLVEGAGEGSSVGAPIAKKILTSWFSR